MPYQLFLQTLASLSSTGHAVIALEHGTIHVRSKPGNNRWHICMPLLQGKASISSDLRSCIPVTGKLRLQQTGPYLELNASTYTLVLIDEIDIHKDRYLSFKKHINDFIAISQEWQEMLGVTANDH